MRIDTQSPDPVQARLAQHVHVTLDGVGVPDFTIADEAGTVERLGETLTGDVIITLRDPAPLMVRVHYSGARAIESADSAVDSPDGAA